jgi:hypothetical protein
MRVVAHSMDYATKADTIRIIPLGDIHAGHRNCDEALLDRTIARIKDDDDAYWGGMGDYCECIWRKDNRHRESNLAPWLHGRDRILSTQRDWIIAKLKPIADRCLWMVIGNHELYALDRMGIDMYHEVVRAVVGENRVRAVSLGVHGYCRLGFGFPSPHGRARCANYYIYAHHGFGGGDLAGGKALKMERQIQRYESDLYFMGHGHDRVMMPRMKVTCHPRKMAVNTKTVIGAYTGSFLRTLDMPEGDSDTLGMYAEEKGLQPLPTGVVEAEITCWTGETTVRI